MGKMLEDVVVEMQMPKSVQNCNLVASHGKYSFAPSTKNGLTLSIVYRLIDESIIGEPVPYVVRLSARQNLTRPPAEIRFESLNSSLDNAEKSSQTGEVE